MAHVSEDVQPEVPPDCPLHRFFRICLPQHPSPQRNRIFSLPDHRHDCPHRHVLNKVGKKGLWLGKEIVLLNKLLRWMDLLDGNQGQTYLFKFINDFVFQSPLDPIRLDHNKRSFH